MGKIKEEASGKSKISEPIAALYEVMTAHEDKENADKILDLYEKQRDMEKMISFTGHFSAGKSSMINALLDEDILAKSPIPTSANIVKISSGEGKVRVYFTEENPIEYKEPYDMEMIKAYSKDKETIKKIEISTGKQIVPKDAAIFDTPGIDAADDADRVMTESSLHLIDSLFYVMDYNHVQSEVNLQFLHSVQQKGIPYYVIINQIDKHDESEISFASFDDSIKLTMEQWGLEPEQIFYASLLDFTVEHNQFNEIKNTLFSLMETKDSFSSNVIRSVNQVITEHKTYVKKQYDEKMEAYSPRTDEIQDHLTRLEELEDELGKLTEQPLELEKSFNKQLQQTLSNAYLMPADLRDKASDFLESQQPEFKVGIFGAKKKTAEERNRRAADFLTALHETIEASVQWKLRDKLTETLKDFHMQDPAFQGAIQNLTIKYKEEDLLHLIKPGAKVTGQSVLNYTNDLENDIKSNFKQQAKTLLNGFKKSLMTANKEKINDVQQEMDQLAEIRDLKRKQEALKQELDEKLLVIDEKFKTEHASDAAWRDLEQELNRRYESIRQLTEQPQANHTAAAVDEKTEEIKEEAKAANTWTDESVLNSIVQTQNIIETLPGFESLRHDLENVANRLSNRTYTMALFGAFSAGKSTFANALLGENVLPTSPNPTTAAVNRIRPVTEEFEHGTVIVTLKDQETLMNDLAFITKKFSPQEEDFHQMLAWVKEKQIYQDSQLNRMHQSYLKALLDGYEESKTLIGDSMTIAMDAFPTYVTDEAKACYIESIDVYYDCTLTRQGITLVDTPGADSVNARHTNVAFDYIKHADVIAYVTYYNHALSRADKDFLMQLGRVKDSFQLDKMFFIVNAADLAVDQEELKLVVNYVKEQLEQLGIRLPDIYPVSSKKALENKLKQEPLNEQMQQLKDRFYDFLYHDLAALTIKAGIMDIHRTYDTLRNYIASFNMDEDAKQNRRQDLKQKQGKASELLEKLPKEVYAQKIEQKLEKQLFYVLERLSIRFHDLFKETFNPTTVTESGRKATTQLKANMENLLDYAGFELLQELRAVSLRVEVFIQTQSEEVYQLLSQKTLELDELFALPNFTPPELETPEYKQAFESIDSNTFEPALKRFKGTKAFFEKNEKEQMRDHLYELLEPFAKEYIDVNKQKMNGFYQKQWSEIIAKIDKDIKTHIENQINSYLEMMTSAVDINELEDKQQLLETITARFDLKEV